ncbi:hypothetical protein [Desulforamulus aeronauticus]|uniref:Uncharacterized protein n=1 Tax=Desulforamulus aeronauticus DSM 10349 TaxID=1121421 RepID=A0A1M6WHA3_9FIRM|nr:hypothetical protein [Desulforamulus aeronauticus]SHK93097.1 hypothetical protein SAMN02745123_03635 [Desulforamulus aeronauticus DSM 10349]
MYLEFDKATGLVLSIHDVVPSEVPLGNDVIETEMFAKGDELTYSIKVTFEGEQPIFSAVRQAPYASYLVQKLQEARRNQALMQAALDELILGGAL